MINSITHNKTAGFVSLHHKSLLPHKQARQDKIPILCEKVDKVGGEFAKRRCQNIGKNKLIGRCQSKRARSTTMREMNL
jgi:hypothetical protein